MVDRTSILAINSLDRYQVAYQFTRLAFVAFWVGGQTTMIWSSGDEPVIGAVIAQYLTETNPPTFDPGTTIIDYDYGTQTIRLDRPNITSGAGGLTVWGYIGQLPFPISSSLFGAYNDLPPFGNNFNLQSSSAYIYGYITKITVSQIQLQYNVPTVNENLNDTFYITDASTGIGYAIQIPHGFYYADELAAVIQTLIQNYTPYTSMTVKFLPRDGFVFTALAPYTNPFYFPTVANLQLQYNIDAELQANVYKTYKLLGMTYQNSSAATTQTSFDYPNFLYTPYIDIYSDTLTNYQTVKDTNTSIANPKGLVARIYVSGTGQIQTTGSTSALGTNPFVMTSDLNSPKVITWTPDVTVTNIDIQLRDQYGDLLPGYKYGYSTEFQMTLLCTED
jgi:hypothetical protein